MRRRDPLTYDVGRHRTPLLSGGSVRLLGLLAVVVVIGAGLVIWTMNYAKPATTTAEPRPALPAVSTRPSPAQRPAAKSSASPVLVGSDARESQSPPPGSGTAASRFIAAWLERDLQVRRAALEHVATAGLTEQLMLTSAGNIPIARVKGSPELEAGSAYSVQYVQTLTTRMRVRVYLVADPGSRYGWLATSVERA